MEQPGNFRPIPCVADLLAILTAVPEDWRKCNCPRCNITPERPNVPDWKSLAAGEKENR